MRTLYIHHLNIVWVLEVSGVEIISNKPIVIKLGFWNNDQRDLKFTKFEIFFSVFVVLIYQIMENGIVYTISLKGQKTGFYADQRESRQFISKISDGQKVLDLCCYSGGFSLNAAHGGALNVTGMLLILSLVYD